MRDYGVEMRELIDKETSITPYSPSEVARVIVETLQKEDIDLLHGYLMTHAVQILRDAINRRDQSVRMVARKGSVREQMEEIAGAIGSGEIKQIKQIRERWLSTTFTLDDGNRHELRCMKRGDLNFVAETYEARAAENAMEARFFRALAQKMQPGKTVGDVLTEEQIVKIREGLARFK